MSSEKCKRLQSNLLQQNVYIRDCSPVKEVSVPAVSSYPELERKETQYGFEEKVVQRDYPITPEYVNSFAETADYKNNLSEAMNAPPRGKGLGDLRDVQELQNMDSVEISRRIAELQKVLSQKSVPVSESVPQNDDKGDNK